jgi:hypothetical protein
VLFEGSDGEDDGGLPGQGAEGGGSQVGKVHDRGWCSDSGTVVYSPSGAPLAETSR